jgi:hypothetical protein
MKIIDSVSFTWLYFVSPTRRSHKLTVVAANNKKMMPYNRHSSTQPRVAGGIHTFISLHVYIICIPPSCVHHCFQNKYERISIIHIYL